MINCVNKSLALHVPPWKNCVNQSLALEHMFFHGQSTLTSGLWFIQFESSITNGGGRVQGGGGGGGGKGYVGRCRGTGEGRCLFFFAL